MDVEEMVFAQVSLVFVEHVGYLLSYGLVLRLLVATDTS